MESWEALDIDDSDLLPPLVPRPSLSKTLLPCSKRPRHHLTQANPEPCSKPQTLDSQSQQPPQVKEFAPAHCTTSKPFTIPGPAGTIQSAMHRRTLKDQTSKDDFSSTQEYLSRAIQEGENAEDDDDFKQNPWVCAVDFIKRSSSHLGVSSSSLKSIKKCQNHFDRVSQVIAIVKSCSPNGLGDLIVTLKDPSGSIGGNIHRKVLTETEFGKDISVGSVLILHKVAVLSPSPSAYYLNITVNNVIKVIRKDSGPPPPNLYPASPVRGPASLTGMIKNPASLRLGTAERITNEDVRGYTHRRLFDDETQSNEHNLLAESFLRTIDSRSGQHAVVNVEPLVRQEVAVEAMASEETNSGVEEIVTNRERQAEGILSGSMNCDSNDSQHATSAKSVDNNFDSSGPGRIAGVTEKHQWTDEQLEELLAGCDDW